MTNGCAAGAMLPAVRGRDSDTLSVVIPTYGREDVLLATIEALLSIAARTPAFVELLVIDQTAKHSARTEAKLAEWSARGAVRWIRLPEPHLTRAMNTGLLEAKGTLVLYLDDDVDPGENLLAGHLDAFAKNPRLSVVVGQILQPGEAPVDVEYRPRGGMLRRFRDFPFNSTRGRVIENAMAGNMTVVRSDALAVGGFDENFSPPVAARFESEFAKRLVMAGKLIWFEPSASLRHLRAPSGGTRSLGSHLTSALPCFGVGDYYFALRVGRGLERLAYVLRKPIREVRTRFHLAHPWWIPVKLIGEIRAFLLAASLARRGARLIPDGRAIDERVA